MQTALCVLWLRTTRSAHENWTSRSRIAERSEAQSNHPQK